MAGLVTLLTWFRQTTSVLSGRSLALIALATLILGWGGFFSQHLAAAKAPTAGLVLKLALDSFVQSLQLFTLGVTITGGEANWAVTIARVTGALIAGTTIVTLLTGAFRRDVGTWLVGRTRGHVIVCGLGDSNLHIAADLAGKGTRKLVALETDGASAGADFCRAKGIRLISGDPGLAETIELANPRWASMAIVSTGDDRRNLAAVRHLVAAMEKAGGAPGPLGIVVSVDDASLAQQIAAEDAFTRPRSSRPVEITLYNAATLAALHLLARFPVLFAPGPGLGPRLRVGVVGLSDVTVEVVNQLVRLSPVPGLQPLLVDLFVEDPDFARAWLSSRSLRLGELVRNAGDGTGTADPWGFGSIVVHALPQLALSPDALALATPDGQESAAPFAAFVVGHPDQNESFRAALALRKALARLERAVPIHVNLPVASSLDAVLADAAEADAGRHRPGVAAFGRLAELCRLPVIIGVREERARALHEFYRTTRPGGAASLPVWPDLQETYRQASRRLVDHLPWLEGLARQRSGGASLAAALEQVPELIEDLAAMEHESWRIDRELDGWRQGSTRDDLLRLHPDLVPYAALPEDSRAATRSLVRMLADFERNVAGAAGVRSS